MGAAVEGAVEHDDVAATRRVLGELDRRLEDLLARAAEVEGVDRAGRQLGEAVGQRFEEVVAVHVDLAVDHPLRLVGDRLDDLRVGEAGRGGGDAAGEVEVLAPVDVDDARADAPLDLDVGDARPHARQVGSARGHRRSLGGSGPAPTGPRPATNPPEDGRSRTPGGRQPAAAAAGAGEASKAAASTSA